MLLIKQKQNYNAKEKRGYEMVNEDPHGYCPRCQARGISREKSIDGRTRCENKHLFLSGKWDEWNEKNPQEPKRKGWATPTGFIDFAEPVTYKEACEVGSEMGKRFEKFLAEKNNAK